MSGGLIGSLIGSLCERYSGDYQRLVVALDKALAEIDRLKLENANLRAENHQLRRILKDHELRMLKRAERDALLLGALHFSGGYTSKRQAQSLGMGENRWCLARALLRFGGALRGGSISAKTPEEFEAFLACGIRIIEAEGGDLLKRGSYRHRQSGAVVGAPSGARGGAGLRSKTRQHSGERGVR